MQRPFYLIAHHINDTASIRPAIAEGANAIECDVKYDAPDFVVRHGQPDLPPSVDLDPDTLADYLDSLAAAASADQPLALVILDVKDTEDAGLAVPLLDVIREHLTSRVELSGLISVAEFTT